ncbi:hypothetical protein P4V41_07720 [Fictibacillus nanhaiensis]|uniref:hypothetical protein n=1 Tax=Fictibacillus nanhaiensis TaxID=742169 RepID=UPI002E221BA4|nr:hypothetical protein [Fictibacillus nanhaiensis]
MDITLEEIVTRGCMTCDLMGDDFIGVKFVGEDSQFWNNLIQDKTNTMEWDDIIDFFTLKNLQNKFKVLEYDYDTWNQAD